MTIKGNPILIVGAGPTGLLLGNALSMQGIRFTLIDKNFEISTGSKALSVNSATLNIFHSLKLIDKLLVYGRKMTDVYLHYAKKRIVHINKKYIRSPYNYFVTIPQFRTEEVLEKALEKNSISVSRGYELKRITEGRKKKYCAEIYSHHDANTLNLEYDFIIGCDGATSRVKKILNVSSSKKDYQTDFIVVDVKLDSDLDLESVHYFFSDGDLTILLPMQAGYTRVVIQQKKDQKETLNDINKLSNHLNDKISNQFNVLSILWYSRSNIFSRVLDTNLREEILLVGDAFHLFSPIGGMGMNTGIQDAYELSWRLSHILTGNSNPNQKKILIQYRENRIKKINEINKLIDSHTDAILNLKPMSNFHYRNFFSPKQTNRSYFRNVFPYIFSGLVSHYFKPDEILLSEGQICPYIPFSHSVLHVFSSIDVFCTNKYCLIVDRNCIKNKLHLFLEANSKLVFFAEPNLSEIHPSLCNFFQAGGYLLISPDSIIALSGKSISVSYLYRYLMLYYKINLK